jgi:hypothetical protein
MREKRVTEKTIEKDVSKLSSQLKYIFGIKDRPFNNYNNHDGYSPRFKIMLPVDLRKIRDAYLKKDKSYDDALDSKDADFSD